jgi:hypothetical protein
MRATSLAARVGCALALCVVCACDGRIAAEDEQPVPDARAPDVRPQPLPTRDAALECSPATPWTERPYKPAAQRLGACSEPQIREYWQACLAPGATQGECAKKFGLVSPATAQLCKACLVTPVSAPALGALLERRNELSLNQAGCFELRGNPRCASAVQRAEECSRDVCAPSCPVSDDVSFRQFIMCTQQARASVCNPWARQADACIGGDRSCAQSGLESAFLAYGDLFCGPAPADAGAPD